MTSKELNKQHRPSLSKRRSSCQGLDPLQIPPETSDGTVSGQKMDQDVQDVVEEGKQLFQNFVVEEIERESPDTLNHIDLSTPQGYKDPLFVNTGRELRLLADQFARTKERQRVRQQADDMPINIDYEDFKDMLSELFLGDGVTNERIVVLFYFCADITIRSLEAGKDMFNRFLQWCTNFIVEKVCWWVERQGGWSQVFRSPFNSTYKKALWMVSAGAIIAFIGFRYWRS